MFAGLALFLPSVWTFQASAIQMPEESLIKSTTTLKEATVFLSGASLTSTGSFQFPAGPSEIVFENIPPGVQANSIQAKGEGNFTVLSVGFRTNYLGDSPKSKEIQQLEDSLEILQRKIESFKGEIWVYETEQQMIVANKTIGGQNTGINSAELEKVANLYRTRLMEIVQKVQAFKESQKKTDLKMIKIQAQLQELNQKRNKNTGEIVVSVHGKQAGSGKMVLTYIVPDASWSPVYDIRANGNAPEITLDCRALVRQNTGMDWKQVDLHLSTGNPYEQAVQPVPVPWWLNFRQVSRMESISTTRKSAAFLGGNAPQAVGKAEDMADSYQAAEEAYELISVEEGMNSVRYDISIPYDVPSDNHTHSVHIQNYTMPAGFRYFAVPRLNPDVFLMAYITGWEKFNLIQGPVNIFFDGNMVGTSSLNPSVTTDTLGFSMGKDKNVTLTRKLLKDFSEKKFVGAQVKESRTYEISIRNKKKSDIDLQLVEQFPLSQNEQIEITLEKDGGGTRQETEGKLTWNLKLKTGSEERIKVGYSVKYPKGQVLSGW